MSTIRALFSDYVTQISVADRLPAGAQPSGFYKDVLDAVNGQAQFYGWRGVTFERVKYARETRVFSVTVSRGRVPATVHLMREHVAAASHGEGLAG